MTVGSVLVQCNDAKVWGPKEIVYEGTHHLTQLADVLRRLDGLLRHWYSSSSLSLFSSGTAGTCACCFLAESSCRSSRRPAVSVLRNSFCDRCSVSQERVCSNPWTHPDSAKPCARYIRLLELPFFLVELKSKKSWVVGPFCPIKNPRIGAHLLRLVFLKRRKMFNP